MPEGVLQRAAVRARSAAELTPQMTQGRGRARFRVAVDNRGNHPVAVTFSGTDRSQALGFGLPSAPTVVEPGRAAFVQLPVKPKRRLWRGVAVPHAFQVTVTPRPVPGPAAGPLLGPGPGALLEPGPGAPGAPEKGPDEFTATAGTRRPGRHVRPAAGAHQRTAAGRRGAARPRGRAGRDLVRAAAPGGAQRRQGRGQGTGGRGGDPGGRGAEEGGQRQQRGQGRRGGGQVGGRHARPR